MIVEMRLYTTRCGNTAEFVELYKTQGLPVQEPVQGRLLGLYVHEFGPMEQVVLMWAYADETDRSVRRAQLRALPAWQAVMPKLAALVESHETRLLHPRAGEILRSD
jgi:hypothetical protein